MQAFVDRSATITAVLAALFAALLELDEGVKKTRKNGLNYAYHENEDILNACRRAMLNQNLMLHTNGGAITESNKRLFQEFVFTFAHVISGEYVAFSWGGVIPAGMIVKSGDWLEDDKASGKLKSYAVKNFLLAFYLIGTPDQDTETGNNAERQYQQARQERTIAPKPATLPPKSSIPEIDDIQQSPDYKKGYNDYAGNSERMPYGTANYQEGWKRAYFDEVGTRYDDSKDVTLPDIADSDKRFDAIPSANGKQAPLTKTQMIHLQTLCKDCNITDTLRHELIGVFTDGKKSSSKELTIVEAEDFIKLLTIEKAGMALGERWTTDVAVAIAEKVSEGQAHNFYALHGSEIDAAWRKVAGLAVKAEVELPAALLPH